MALSVEQLAASMPFFGLIGAELVDASPEVVRARLAWDDSRCTAGGVMHGGALMALADGCGAVCAFLNLPDGAKGTATIESKTNFLGALRSGHANAVSRVLHAGRTTIVVDTEIVDDDGRRVAAVRQTQAVLM